VATSSSRKNFKIKAVNNQELFKLFGDNITCGDDEGIKNGKPSPDLFIAAWKKLGEPNLENVLVFEDSLNGIEAAKNAEMKVSWFYQICK